MKKTLVLLLTLLMSMSLFGCQKKKDPSDGFIKYNSLEEINKLANVELIKPAIMGIENESFYLIEQNTASYVFEANGYQYFIRGTKELSYDMSGIFTDKNKPLFNTEERIQYGETSEYKAYRFVLGNTQFVFAMKDEGKIEKELFDAQFEDVFNLYCYEPTFEEIRNGVGYYQDSTSQRASMEVSLVDINVLKFDITWPSSASEYDEWIIVASPIVYKIDYEDITHKRVVINDEGNEKETILDDYGPGYFEVESGIVKWTGSGNKQTSSCVFEKIEIVN